MYLNTKFSNFCRISSNSPSHCPIFFRIQQVDGGFFEKFGSLFREQAEYAATQEQIEKQRVAEAAAQVIPVKDEEETVDNEAVPTVDSDADTSISSDSEVEGEKEKNELIATAWNVSTPVLFREFLNIFIKWIFISFIFTLTQPLN